MRMQLMLATRFGPSSAEPARVAAELADRLDARITVLYVATELAALEQAGGEAGVDPAAERERLHERIDRELDAFTARHLAGREVAVQIVAGRDIAETVASAAADAGAAYLVVGTRARSQIARLILGDTTHGILQRAPCPVIVVPLPDEPDAS